MKYIIEVDAWQAVEKVNVNYGYNPRKEEYELVQVSDSQIHEAITKYLQVKGFSTRQVSVTKAKD